MHNLSELDHVYPLYDPRWEHDACGTGFIAQISGEASYFIVQTALQSLAHLTHRGAQDADAETGDGSGLLTQIPQTLFYEELLAQHITAVEPDDLDDLPVGRIVFSLPRLLLFAHLYCAHSLVH